MREQIVQEFKNEEYKYIYMANPLAVPGASSRSCYMSLVGMYFPRSASFAVGAFDA